MDVNVWAYRGLRFVGVPTIILLLGFLLGAVIFWFWLIFLASYVALMSVLGTTTHPPANSKTIVSRAVRLLGSVIWGGFLLVLYYSLYLIIFHYGDMMAH